MGCRRSRRSSLSGGRPREYSSINDLTAARVNTCLPGRQPADGLQVLVSRFRDDVRRQARTRRALVPIETLEIVAHELLVEARRAGAHAIGIGRPEAR